MQFSDKQIQEFQKLHSETTGEEISAQEAKEELLHLTDFMSLLLKKD